MRSTRFNISIFGSNPDRRRVGSFIVSVNDAAPSGLATVFIVVVPTAVLIGFAYLCRSWWRQPAFASRLPSIAGTFRLSAVYQQ